MNLGTQNKKEVGILAALALVAAYFVYTNLLAGPDIPPSSRGSAPMAVGQAPAPASVAAPVSGPPAAKRALSRNRTDEFHPVYLSRNPADRPDPTKIDPTLKRDLLAKVQSVELAGGARNVFQFGQAPPKEPVKLAAKGPEPIVRPFVGPRTPPPPVPPPPPPPPPPITLKFYGFSTSADNGKKTAYLLDGDEIYLASEGQTLKRRYKILRIGPNSVLIEDLDAKRQQSVPLTEEGTG